MSNDLTAKIHAAQIAAGERVVMEDLQSRGLAESNAPSYNELVRALAFTIKMLDDTILDHKDLAPLAKLQPIKEAQLESARKLLLRAQAAQ